MGPKTMVTNYRQWYVTSQKSEDLKGSVVFHWHAYLVGTVKCGSGFLTIVSVKVLVCPVFTCAHLQGMLYRLHEKCVAKPVESEST